MISFLKRMASRLPLRYQQELKRIYFARLIRKGLFTTAEPNETELERLDQWVGAGDWVIDIGANVGNYSARLSALVQASGRVFSIEPVPETFELLVANMARVPLQNITMLNVAASDEVRLCGMTVPKLDTGLDNRYMAHLAEESVECAVMCLPVDALRIPRPVQLVKIDVEGHELRALKGMEGLLKRDHPLLIIEGRSAEVAAYLASFGYSFEESNGSPNRVFRLCA